MGEQSVVKISKGVGEEIERFLGTPQARALGLDSKKDVVNRALLEFLGGLLEARFVHINTWEDKIRIVDRQHPDTLIDILIRNRKLYCTFDKRADCEHVGFAWTLPQVRRALAK